MTVGAVDRVIGANVHEIMRRRSLTARQLAPSIGMSESGLSRRLRGERGWRAKDVVNTARELGVTVVDLHGADTVDVLPAHGRPFCDAHPNGTLEPCRVCGRARLALVVRDYDERRMARELDVSNEPALEVNTQERDAEVVRPVSLRFDMFDPHGVRLLRVEIEAGPVEEQHHSHEGEPIGGAQ